MFMVLRVLSRCCHSLSCGKSSKKIEEETENEKVTQWAHPGATGTIL
jgi:hypothetical protein